MYINSYSNSLAISFLFAEPGSVMANNCSLGMIGGDLLLFAANSLLVTWTLGLIMAIFVFQYVRVLCITLMMMLNQNISSDKCSIIPLR